MIWGIEKRLHEESMRTLGVVGRNMIKEYKRLIRKYFSHFCSPWLTAEEQ